MPKAILAHLAQLTLAVLVLTPPLFALDEPIPAWAVLFPHFAQNCHQTLARAELIDKFRFPPIEAGLEEFSNQDVTLGEFDNKERPIIPLEDGSFLNRYAALLALSRIDLKAAPVRGRGKFEPLVRTLRVGPGEFFYDSLAGEVVLRFILHHGTNYANFFIDFQNGRMSPLHGLIVSTNRHQPIPGLEKYNEHALTFREIYIVLTSIYILSKSIPLIQNGEKSKDTETLFEILERQLERLTGITEALVSILHKAIPGPPIYEPAWNGLIGYKPAPWFHSALNFEGYESLIIRLPIVGAPAAKFDVNLEFMFGRHMELLKWVANHGSLVVLHLKKGLNSFKASPDLEHSARLTQPIQDFMDLALPIVRASDWMKAPYDIP